MAQLAAVINTLLQQVSDDLTPFNDQDLLPASIFLGTSKLNFTKFSLNRAILTSAKPQATTASKLGFA